MSVLANRKAMGYSHQVILGQHSNATSLSVAEIIFPDVVLGATFEVEMKVTKIPGTVSALMTTHADNKIPTGPTGWKDQQVMKVLSNSLFRSAGAQPVGINMVNYEAK